MPHNMVHLSRPPFSAQSARRGDTNRIIRLSKTNPFDRARVLQDYGKAQPLFLSPPFRNMLAEYSKKDANATPKELVACAG